MDLADLANKESELHLKVLGLLDQKQTKEMDEQLQDIIIKYRKVHNLYADLAHSDTEALKRGLFIQWYALAEPNYLTGISNLDEQAELKIIDALNDVILKGTMDEELHWMLDYYLSWDWIFEKYSGYKGLETSKMNREERLPERIDREMMKKRGQMGLYWNSLTVFE